MEKSEKHDIFIFLPQELKTAQLLQMQLRLEFINAIEAAEGRKYELKKEDVWYKTPVANADLPYTWLLKTIYKHSAYFPDSVP